MNRILASRIPVLFATAIVAGCGIECNIGPFLTVEPQQPILNVGDTFVPYSARISDCGPGSISVSQLRWSSSDTTILRPTSDSVGLVAIRPGSTQAVGVYVGSGRGRGTSVALSVVVEGES